MNQLIITHDPDTNQVQVQGPVGNKMLCYSILECARDAIKDFNDAQRAKATDIVPASRIVSLNGR